MILELFPFKKKGKEKKNTTREKKILQPIITGFANRGTNFRHKKTKGLSC